MLFMTTFLMLGLVGMKPNVHIPNGIVLSEPTELEKFLQHIGRRESNNNPTVVNQYGMLGKYQFSPMTLRYLAGDTLTKQQFLRNPELQDTVMVRYMRDNNSHLRDLIFKYEGTIFKGVKVTRAGILAAAHLAGPQGVRSFFRTTDLHGRRDGNGTSVRDYLVLFSGYNLGEVF
jgi:hypothetical protein